MPDVAALAGVSLSTVSRVVNGEEAVRPDLAERVRDAIEMLGYRRDLTASNLRRADRVSASVGLLVEDVSNPFFSALHRGFEEVARRRRVLTFVGSSDEDPERERELVQAFCARRVDGLVIAPVARDQSYLARELQAGMAVVFIDRPPDAIYADAVIIDNAGAASDAVDHLVAAGHRRIGFLGDRLQVYTAGRRLAGYRRACDRHDLPSDDALVRSELANSELSFEAATELVGGPKPPTALLCAQNLITVGAVRALRELGLQHQVAMVGIDDVMMADALEPGVTVVAQDPVGIGRAAAERLFARLDGESSPVQRTVVRTELIVRGSGEIAAPP
jgi:LacI family transcriptional regulator